MKKLIIINGPMGVGKTTVSKNLFNSLKPSVLLDGDWCWNMNPFLVNDENKKMVLNNIKYLLKNYLNNSNFEYIIFCWVIPEEEILNDILSDLPNNFELHKFTLTCDPDSLKYRLLNDINRQISQKTITDSLSYIPKYNLMDTTKIDSTDKSINQIVELLISKIQKK